MSSPSRQPIKVGILGATGTVGQRFIELLASHPYFVIHALGASARSAGQQYAKVTKWKLSIPIPDSVKTMVVQQCTPDAPGFSECGVVFSGLDHDVAGEIEVAFRAAELIIFSNAKNYRRDPLVPLMVPLVNTSHISVVRHQQACLSPPTKKGYIVCNANCSTTGIVVPLHALEKAFGPVTTVIATTLQAISGAGYPGVSSMDIIDNVVPYIGSEEEKIEWETAKILGNVNEDNTGFTYHSESPLKVSAACNRVPVIDGHTACVSVKFARSPAPSVEEINKALVEFTCEAQELGVPSAPKRAIVVHDAPDRPQPRLDRDLEKGACVNVGRVRECGVLDIKFVCMMDNVRLGAATSSVMNAEVAVEKGYIV
ncbi:aspartate-semialdehyde dehydrogenase, partial [Tremellales sp. Uapishka_1]